MKKLLTTAIVAFALIGCTSQTTSTTTNNTTTTQSTAAQTSTTSTTVTADHTIILTATKDGAPIDGSPFTFGFKEGDNLLDVMKANLTIEEKDGFITSINGVEQEPSENKYWLFDVNSVMSPVGAKEVILKDGDVVDWKLEAYKQ